MPKRMSDAELNEIIKASDKLSPELIEETKRCRGSEEKLKSQILALVDYLVDNFPTELLNESDIGVCKTAVGIIEKQKTQLELYAKLNELFKLDSHLKNLDRKKLVDVIKKMSSICMQ